MKPTLNSQEDTKKSEIREAGFSFFVQKERLYMSPSRLVHNVSLYVSSHTKRKKMLQAIQLGYRSEADISWYAKSSDRAVRQLFHDSKVPEGDAPFKNEYMMFKVLPDFDKVTKMQKANIVIFDPEFLYALNWLRSNGYLNSPTSKRKQILKHAESVQNNYLMRQKAKEKPSKLPPPPHRQTSSLPKDLNPKDRIQIHTLTKPFVHKSNFGIKINHLVDLRGLDDGAKLYATKYASDHAIIEALEVCRWYEKKKKIKKTPSALFMGVLKKKMAGVRYDRKYNQECL